VLSDLRGSASSPPNSARTRHAGHDVHFITYANPIRLDPTIPAFTITRSKSPITALSYPRIARARLAHGEVARATISTSCTSTTPSRIPSPPCSPDKCCKSAGPAVHHYAARNRHHPVGVDPLTSPSRNSPSKNRRSHRHQRRPAQPHRGSLRRN